MSTQQSGVDSLNDLPIVGENTLSKEAQEIYNYVQSITQENTSAGEFNNYLDKYSLEHILEAYGEISKDVPWYEELKPGTIVVDASDYLYVAYYYKNGYILDAQANVIGKPAHLQLATAQEVGGLHHG